MLKPTTNRIFGLDLMRATAILMVLLGHCLWIFPQKNNLLYQTLQLFGFLGVEFFFILSGFLIGNILLKLFLQKKFTFATALFFLKRRWFRTLPNYFLILLLNILIAAAIGYQIPQLWRYFLFLQNFNTTMLPFFPESWSLSVEEFAYILLPILLIILNACSKKHKAKLYLASVLLVIVVSTIAKIIYTNQTTNTTLNQWNVSLKSVVIYRLDAIYLGILASWIHFHFANLWEKLKHTAFLLGALVLVFLFFGLRKFNLLIEINPFFWNVLYLPLTSLGVALCLPLLSLWKTEVSFIQKPIEFISKISYSIYLIHYSLILYLMKIYFNTNDFSKAQLYIFTLIYLVLVLLFSYLLYRFFEKPMMDLRDKNQ